MSYTKSDIKRLRNPRRRWTRTFWRIVAVLASLGVGILTVLPAPMITGPVLRSWSGEMTSDQYNRPPSGQINATSVGVSKSDPNVYDLFISSAYWSDGFFLFLYGENRGGLVSITARDQGNFSTTPYTANASNVESINPNASALDYAYLFNSHYWLNLTPTYGGVSANTTRLGFNYSAFSVSPTVSTVLMSRLEVRPAGPKSSIELVGTSLNLSVGNRYVSLQGVSSIVISNYSYAILSVQVSSETVPIQPGAETDFRGPASLAFRGVNGTLRSDVPETFPLSEGSLWVSNASEISLVLSPMTSAPLYVQSLELTATAGRVRVASPNVPTYPSGITSVDAGAQTTRVYFTVGFLVIATAASQYDLLSRALRRIRSRR